MNENKLVAACAADRLSFAKITEHVSHKEISPIAKIWLDGIRDYYARDESAERADLEVVGETLALRLASDKQRETVLAYGETLKECPSPDNVVHAIIEYRRHISGMQLAQALADGGAADKVRPLVEQYAQLLEETQLGSDIRYASDGSALFERVSSGKRIRLHPASLNSRSRGGALPGHHIVIFGRPEQGKTLFAVNLTAGFLRDGHKVLYIGNEDPIDEIKMRVLCNLANCSEDQAVNEPEKALRIAEGRGLGLLTMVHMHPGSAHEVESLVKEHGPEVLIIDQIRNLAGDDNSTRRMEQNAIAVRNILGKYDVVGVSITQAGDKTERHGQEPPMWLSMGDVDSSRTGLPAQADMMIGVGSNEELRSSGKRAISLPKNKIGRVHDGFIVEVDTVRSKVL